MSLKTLDESLEKVMESVTINLRFKHLRKASMTTLNLIKKSLSFDYRSMALYRALVGLLIMLDVLHRVPDFTNFYTDVGLVPRSLFTNEMAMPWSFSLLMANGSTGFVWVMFGLQLLFGFMILIGFKTRWAIFGAYLMSVSIHNRNWLVNNGGDDAFRALLFFSIFLPLNRFFSVDSALTKNKEPQDESEFSSWTMVFTLQAFVIYFVSYLLKNHPMWRSDFTAIFFSSRLDIFATPAGIWLREFPTFLKISTIFTSFTEFICPLLLVFSFLAGKRWWWVKLFAIALFLGLHTGIAFTMWIGLFPFYCMAMWCIFFPSQVWDLYVSQFRQRGFGKITLYFDGDCRFCEKAVLIIREFLLLPEVAIVKAQDSQIIHKHMIKENSWVIVNEKGDRFFHFSAFLQVMKHSPLLFLFTPIFDRSFFLKLFNVIYHWIAGNRQLMSKWSQYILFQEPRKKIKSLSLLYQIFGIYIFLCLFTWNLATIKPLKFTNPVIFQATSRWLHLYQEWNMFAPFPKLDNVWVEIPAILSDGSEIELLTGSRDVISNKEKDFYQLIPNEHWRKFYLNLGDKTDYARYYGGYLCREWNVRGKKLVPNTSLKKLEIVVYSQLNLPDGDRGGISRKLSWRHWCYDEDYKKEKTR